MKHDLLTEIEDYLAWRTEIGKPIGPVYFCKKSANNPVLLDRLRKGGDVRTKTAKQVRKFIREDKKRITGADNENAPVSGEAA
ncbi:hypothetical protein [Flexibacterium corallicola]|uniref:hypothetical protein n=1 Tax=Flexibacterium corallicola TaxID=3037259 RepID=UPI00286EC099|nr:hypothetical protein [Pseudovibrio sp. M1P-2-3]